MSCGARCGAQHTGSADPTSSEPGLSFTANAGMVSDKELEQMLDSGQSEVFVSNVSGPHQPLSAGPPILSESFLKK